MIVVVIIGVLAAIAYPSYQSYVIKTKRADMMSEMRNIASEIESRKLVQGKYSSVVTNDLIGSYPRQGNALYNITISPVPLNLAWTITAIPITATQMKSDGTLTLNYQGIKCRERISKVCGSSDEWSQ